MTADFGLNWADVATPPAPGAPGAIGDYVWSDSDADGVQDADELGLGGVQMLLRVDTNGNGVYGDAGDAAPLSTLTDATGHYVFDGVAPGAYVVELNASTLPASHSNGNLSRDADGAAHRSPG